MGPPLTSESKTDAFPQEVPANGTERASESSARTDESSSLGSSGNVGPSHAGDQQAWGMTQGDRRVVFVLACTVFLLMVVNWVRIVGWQPSPLIVERPQSDEYRFVVDVNTATWVEWMQLDGIGEVMARRIVAHREEHGPFETIEEVDHVPGVGPKTFSKIRDQLECQPPSVHR